MVSLLPQPLLQLSDSNGNPYAGGTLTFSIPGTTTPKTTWSDSGGTVANSNPVVLDSAGRASVWGGGQYRCILHDAGGNLIFDRVTGSAELITFATIAAMRAGSGTAGQVAFVQGYASAHDGGEGVFFAASGSQADNGGTVFVDAASTRWFRAGSPGLVNIKWFGAVGDGVTDCTTALRNAVATGLSVYIPTGSYVVTGAITCTTKGQMIHGAGRAVSIVRVTAGFNLSAAGVFIVSTGEQAPIFQDFQIFFVQPDTSTRASLTSYPPAIYANIQPRMQIRNMAIWAGMMGVGLVGNCGGVYIDDLQVSCFNQAIQFSGGTSFDTCRISRVQCWNFGLTANQTNIFVDNFCFGLNILTGVTDLHVTDCLFICGGEQLNCTSVDTWAEVVNCGFDAYGQVNLAAGRFWEFTNCYWSMSNAACLANTGVYFLSVSNCHFEFGTLGGTPCISVQANAASGQTFTQISNCTFNMTGVDSSAIRIASVTSGVPCNVSVSNCSFIHLSNVNYTNAIISVLSGGGSARLSAANNRVTDKGTGTGTFISIAADDYHRVIGNVSPGWTNSFPAATGAIYQYN